MNKQCKYILLFLALSLLLFGATPQASRQNKPYPGYEGKIILPGLRKNVTVYRDERGMPHIYAENEHDLYLTVGYISAQERLWQMDLIRRGSAGRLSEIFGKSFLEADRFARCLQVSEKSKKMIENENPKIIDCLEAYIEGVNNYISTVRKLPVEFRILSYSPELWTLADITSITGAMGWALAERNFTSELFNFELVRKVGMEKASRLIADWKVEPRYVYPDFKLDISLISNAWSSVSEFNKIIRIGIGTASCSNNWAVSGRKTETGKPFLSNDIHLAFNAPGIWMQMHQVIPGKLNVTGILIPGEPFIVAGHNEKIAWGVTNLSVDDIDLYAEKIDPDSHARYFFNGEWKFLSIKNEIIKIRGGKTDTVRISFTHRGPIISQVSGIKDAALSFRWSGFDLSDEIRSVYLLNRASCWDEFRYAISTFRSLSQNFVYADSEGNIGMNAAGGIPLRKTNGNLVRKGETDEYDWKGFVPFEQLPFSYNPESGYVSSANNKPVNDNYPYYISNDFAIPYRIIRIRQMLDRNKTFNIEDFKEMINDQHSELAKMAMPLLKNLIIRRTTMTQQELIALDTILKWDYDMNPGMAAPTIFEYFRVCLKKNLLADELDEIYNKLAFLTGEYYIYKLLNSGPDEWVDNVHTSEIENLDTIVLQSFKESIGMLVRKYGKNMKNWKWGEIHKIKFIHPLGNSKILNLFFGLNSGELSIGGSDHTVNSFYNENSGYAVTNGVSEKHIFNTDNWDESLTVIPGGASGVPGSEYYLSQIRTFVNGKFYKDIYSGNAIESSKKYTMIFKPEN